jgi:hypothetical protein
MARSLVRRFAAAAATVAAQSAVGDREGSKAQGAGVTAITRKSFHPA